MRSSSDARPLFRHSIFDRNPMYAVARPPEEKHARFYELDVVERIGSPADCGQPALFALLYRGNRGGTAIRPARADVSMESRRFAHQVPSPTPETELRPYPIGRGRHTIYEHAI
jgi:hypothetical protein